MNIAMNAISLGPPWLKRDRRAKNVQFIYNVESFTERFKESWELKEKWQSELASVEKDVDDGALTDAGAPAQGSGESPLKKPRLAGTQPIETGKGKGKDKDKGDGSPGKATTGKGSGGKNSPGKNQTALLKGLKLKAKYTNVVCAAAALESTIAKCPNWEWCREQNADTNFKEVFSAMKAAAADDEFARVAMATDVPILKKKYGVAQLEVNFQKMISVLLQPLKKLTSEVDKLNKWHEIAMAAHDSTVHGCHGPVGTES